MERQIELVPGEGGRQTLRIPREMFGAEKIASLEARVAELSAALTRRQEDPVAKTGAVFEAWARDQVEAQQSALKASVDGATEVAGRIAAALEALVSAVASKDVAITVHNPAVTFSPTIQPANVLNRVDVEARVQLPPPREKKIAITVDENGNAEGTVT